VYGVELEEVARAFEIGPAAWTQQAVGADLGESAREYVLEKSCEESLHRERDTPRFA
jgi:hypothetical protein